VNSMHITASVFINDDERGLHADYEKWLEGLAPHAPTSHYQHNRTCEDNTDAHLKRQVMGREVVVAVTGGRLDFGTWERIFYGEFDGRRRKRGYWSGSLGSSTPKMCMLPLLMMVTTHTSLLHL
jgi:secondary thiamine-phosphate synthase enzyme